MVWYNPKSNIDDHPGKIRTVTGKQIDLLAITEDDIDIEDIAYGLAHTARFAGQTRVFYSVAEHSISVMANLPLELKIAGLLHDASEAYIGDMPSPIKLAMPDYRYIEDKIMEAIAKKFNFKWPLDSRVKKIDKKILLKEWSELVIGDDDIIDETPKKSVISCFLRLFEHVVEEQRIYKERKSVNR